MALTRALERTVRKRALAALYQARFGAVPPALALKLEETHELPRLQEWLLCVSLAPDASEVERKILGV